MEESIKTEDLKETNTADTAPLATDTDEPASLSAAQRARSELQRSRALAKRARAAVTAPPPQPPAPAAIVLCGGFIPERSPSPARLTVQPAAPPAARADWPTCRECARRFPASQLWDTFSWAVCDECREDERHALVTRADAKSEFLLKDCDLDSREPPLRCVRRRNPHGSAPMRLYVRDAVYERACLVWGGEAALAAERARRVIARSERSRRQHARSVRALRRAALPPPLRAAHEHVWGEPSARDEDTFVRVCRDCGLEQIYETM